MQDSHNFKVTSYNKVIEETSDTKKLEEKIKNIKFYDTIIDNINNLQINFTQKEIESHTYLCNCQSYLTCNYIILFGYMELD